MAKRARGTTSRPGQRAPIRRSGATRPSPDPVAAPDALALAPRPVSLTAEEEARAAELEARIVAAERAADEAAQRRSRGRRAAADLDASGRGGSIALRAAEEYGYVMRDVRRIALIGGFLLALLIGIWVVTQVAGAPLA